MYPVIEYFNDVEGGICLRFNRLSRHEWVRRLFSVVSRLGDGGIWALLAALLLLQEGPAALPMVLQMAVTGAIGVLIYKLIKNRLVRERPYINHGDIRCGTAPLDKYSFPSGHTLHATSFAILLSQFEPLWIPIVMPFAALVAASRVILGLHYPSDVVVGAAIGTALASLSLAIV
jgi:undecaprenyl-diphosphatase